jgi:hypothetical protein
MINVTTATTAELLAFFNANSGATPVKKFADRKTAERRVSALIATMPAPKAEPAAKETKAGATVVRTAAKGTVAGKTAKADAFDGLTGKTPKVAAPVAKKAETAEKAPAAAATRLYEVADTSSLKRGAIYTVVLHFDGKQFTREEFVAKCAEVSSVHGMGHFYWAKAHGVIAPVAA